MLGNCFVRAAFAFGLVTALVGCGGGDDKGSNNNADSGSPAPDGGGPAPDGGMTSSKWPVITSHGGMGLSPMKMVTIVTSGDADQASLFAFGDAVANSQWWASFKGDYGLSTFSNTNLAGDALAGPAVSDAQMIAYIKATIAAKSGPAPDASTLFLLYLPDGVNSSDSTSGEVNTDCKGSSGYHTITSDGMVWGVVERCPVTYTGWTKLMGVTQTAAHEIAEAATNPDVMTGWFLSCPMGTNAWSCASTASGGQGEVGDLCAETAWREGGYAWTRVWSKSAAAAGGDPCVPAMSTGYFDTATPEDWYTVTAGQTVTIPVTGVITQGSFPDWTVSSTLSKESPSGVFMANLSGMSMGVGQMLNLTVSASQGAASGNWAVIGINSYSADPTTNDPMHPHFVGVYVP